MTLYRYARVPWNREFNHVRIDEDAVVHILDFDGTLCGVSTRTPMGVPMHRPTNDGPTCFRCMRNSYLWLL